MAYGDIIICALLLALAIFATYSAIRQRKKGGCGCGCNCAHCHGACHRNTKG